jgi:hypothetical protein
MAEGRRTPTQRRSVSMSHHSNDEDHHTGQGRPGSPHDKQRIGSETGTVHRPDPIAGSIDPDAGTPAGQDAGAGAQREMLSRPEQILQDGADKEDISDEEAVLAYNANAGPDAGEPGAQRAGAGAQNEVLSRPEQILQDGVDKESISDEEAVLAYNANAEPEDEGTGTAAEK